MKEKDTKNSRVLEIIIYDLVIIILAIVFTFLFHKEVSFSTEISSTTMAAITGYSFTALFFLMALPREGFIKKIDDDGKLIFYGVIIGTPAFFGTIQLILASIDVKSVASFFLFFATSFCFILSIIFVFLILAVNRTTKKKHKSV